MSSVYGNLSIWGTDVKAMILAAGKGERMMPLTKSTPKPLLQAGNKALIEYHIEALVHAGITDIVINTAKFGEQIESALGDGEHWRVRIQYSHEGENPKGTGGGVQLALPLLGKAPFVLINGDVWTDYDFRKLNKPAEKLAHLIMVENPIHNQAGDFGLSCGQVVLDDSNKLTYSGIGIFNPEFFSSDTQTMVSFVPSLQAAIKRGLVSGEKNNGLWFDIGTPQRLEKLDILLK
jgi:N-acetyl-alpha-D-muramate 1-phosphate uridylyltransferase